MSNAGLRGTRYWRSILGTLVMACALSAAVSAIVSTMTVWIFTWSDSASEAERARQVAFWEVQVSIPCRMQTMKAMADSVGESADFRRGFTAAREAGEGAFAETAENLAAQEVIWDRIRGKQAIIMLVATGILVAIILQRSYQLKKATDRIAVLEQAAAKD